MKRCPEHPGAGYFTKGRASGPVRYFYNNDGTDGDNTLLHDQLVYKEGSVAFCEDCGRRLGQVVKSEYTPHVELSRVVQR